MATSNTYITINSPKLGLTRRLNYFGLEDQGYETEVVDYSLDGPTFKAVTYPHKWRSTTSFYNVLPEDMRSLKITVKLRVQSDTFANTRGAFADYKRELDKYMQDRVRIKLPDGYYYDGYCDAIGAPTMSGGDTDFMGIWTYSFKVLPTFHGELVTKSGDSVTCSSTVTRTSCRLTKTITEAAEVYKLGTVKFYNVEPGDVLQADGILGRILVNGAPATNDFYFTTFPFLVPGENTNLGSDTIEYYPTYI